MCQYPLSMHTVLIHSPVNIRNCFLNFLSLSICEWACIYTFYDYSVTRCYRTMSHAILIYASSISYRIHVTHITHNNHKFASRHTVHVRQLWWGARDTIRRIRVSLHLNDRSTTRNVRNNIVTSWAFWPRSSSIN